MIPELAKLPLLPNDTGTWHDCQIQTLNSASCELPPSCPHGPSIHILVLQPTSRGMALIDGGMAEATACQHSSACTGTERSVRCSDWHTQIRQALVRMSNRVPQANTIYPPELLEGEMVLLQPVPVRHVLGPRFPLTSASNSALRARQSLFLPCPLHASLPGRAEPAVSKSGNFMKPGTYSNFVNVCKRMRKPRQCIFCTLLTRRQRKIWCGVASFSLSVTKTCLPSQHLSLCFWGNQFSPFHCLPGNKFNLCLTLVCWLPRMVFMAMIPFAISGKSR